MEACDVVVREGHCVEVGTALSQYGGDKNGEMNEKRGNSKSGRPPVTARHTEF